MGAQCAMLRVMSIFRRPLNRSVAALLISALFSGGAFAQSGPDQDKIDRLLGELAKEEQPGWQQIAENIRIEWSKSGSPAMDLLLQRGREALEAEDYGVAVEHLSALIDHAPGFAEGWNLRATAFYRMERWGLALNDIQQTLALNPQHFGAMAGLGFVLQGMERPEAALDALQRSATLNPHVEEVQQTIERLERDTQGIDI